MKSADQILDRIDRFIFAALERPSMYASSPIALEQVLARLDELRDFILSEREESFVERSSYGKYLSQTGYGVGMFCALTDRAPAEQFQPLAKFWKQYLESTGRMTGQESCE
jgi:hypothetical protein